MNGFVFFLISLVIQAPLRVEALPPGLEVEEGRHFFVRIIVQREKGEEWPPRIRPLLKPPDGLELIKVSAQSGSVIPSSGAEDSLEYRVELRAGKSGEYRLDEVGVVYWDRGANRDQELKADAFVVKVVPGRPLGIGAGWAVFLGLVSVLGVGLVARFYIRKGKAWMPGEPQAPGREWAWRALEDIRRFRIRGEEIQFLDKIMEVERLLPDSDPKGVKALEEKIERLKYGGQRLSPAELEEIYRRVEIRIKSRYPGDEVA